MRLEFHELITRIVELSLTERTIRCESDFPSEGKIFDGHFPSFPVVPGTILAEAMAQAAGWLIVAIENFERMPFLGAVRDAKFRTFVPPGRRIILNARIVSYGASFALTEAKGELDGKVICDGMLTFLIGDFPTEHLRAHTHKVAPTLGFPFAALAK